MTTEAIDEEEREDSQMFRDALLNGDEKINRLVKLVDTRLESQARRTNKARKEARDEMAKLRKDLGPLIELADVLSFIFSLPWAWFGSAAGAVLTVAGVLWGLGIRP